MEVVATYLQMFEAEAACAALNAAGIRATMLDRHLGVNVPYLTQGFRIGVPGEQLADAVALLARHTATAPAALEEEDAYGEPAYGPGWIGPIIFGALTLRAVWRTVELALLDRTALGLSALDDVFLIGLAGLAALLYAVTTVFTWQGRVGGRYFWLAGWIAAVSSQFIFAEHYKQVVVDPPTGLGGFILFYLGGHIISFLCGIGLWEAEVRKNWK